MSQPTIVRAGRLIDGLGGVRKNVSILIEGGRIASIDDGDGQGVPSGAGIIDAAHLTLLPGLMDIHLHLASPNVATRQNTDVAHFSRSHSTILLEATRHAQLLLEAGFTTIRDFDLPTPGGPIHEAIVSLRDAFASGLLNGPRILVAGMAHITASHFDLSLPRSLRRQAGDTADGPWEFRRQVRQNIRDGVDWLKTCISGGLGTFAEEDIWSRNVTIDELQAMVDEAHAFGKRTAAHCHTPDSVRMAVAAGVDTIEHCVFIDDDAIARVVEAGRYVIPTLAFRQQRIIDRRRRRGAPEAVLQQMESMRDSANATFQRYHRAGAKIALGTDTNVEPGFGENAFEMEVYVNLGMSPMEAISTATSNAAAALGMADELGSISIGKAADLILVDGNPLDDIALLGNKERIRLVMRGGRVLVDRMTGSCVGSRPAGGGA